MYKDSWPNTPYGRFQIYLFIYLFYFQDFLKVSFPDASLRVQAVRSRAFETSSPVVQVN